MSGPRGRYEIWLSLPTSSRISSHPGHHPESHCSPGWGHQFLPQELPCRMWSPALPQFCSAQPMGWHPRLASAQPRPPGGAWYQGCLCPQLPCYLVRVCHQALLWHPDAGPGGTHAASALQRATGAHNTLISSCIDMDFFFVCVFVYMIMTHRFKESGN